MLEVEFQSGQSSFKTQTLKQIVSLIESLRNKFYFPLSICLYIIYFPIYVCMHLYMYNNSCTIRKIIF